MTPGGGGGGAADDDKARRSLASVSSADERAPRHPEAADSEPDARTISAGLALRGSGMYGAPVADPPVL